MILSVGGYTKTGAELEIIRTSDARLVMLILCELSRFRRKYGRDAVLIRIGVLLTGIRNQRLTAVILDD